MSRATHRFWFSLNRGAIILTLLVFFRAQVFAAPKSNSKKPCDAPSVLGICDPYVPGTIGETHGKKGFVVTTTWPGGPAEKAGICAGDTIVAVDGVWASTLGPGQIVKLMVSRTPGPATLTVQRGKQLKVFKLYRAKESTLIGLSKQKYCRFVGFGSSQIMLPEEETASEVRELEAYEKRLAARYGFWVVEDYLPVPNATPKKAIEELRQVGSVQSRLRPVMAAWIGGPEYWTGAVLTVLQDPKQVLVRLVMPNSPAYHAGLLPGDQLLEINGDALSPLGLDQLKALFKGLDAPRLITLKMKRGDLESTLKITPEDAQEVMQSDPLRELPFYSGPPSGDACFLGVNVLFDGTGKPGMVSRVDYPSPAFDAGLHPGDTILSIDRTPVRSLTREQLNALLLPKGPSPVTFRVSRLGKHLTFRIVPTTHAKALAKIGRKMTKFGPAAMDCPG